MKNLVISALMVASTATAVEAQVRINEIDPTGKWAEIVNESTTDAADVSGWFICREPSYAQLSSLNIQSGSTNIPPGGFLVVDFASIESPDGELGLYRNDNDFGNSANIIDYVEYGAAVGPRESVAVAAGVWVAGEFTEAVPQGQTVSNFGGGVGAASWAPGEPTPGAVNQRAGAVSVTEDTPEALTGTHRLGQAFPNPTSERAAFELQVARQQDVRVTLFDVTGREVQSVFHGALQPDVRYRFDLPLNGLPPGVYIYSVAGITFADSGIAILTN